MPDIYIPNSPSKSANTNARKLLDADDKLVLGGVSSAITYDALEETLLNIIMTTLNQHYPAPKGLPLWWAVEVSNSVIHIFNLALSGKHGMVMHVNKSLNTEKIVRFGGELLERYGISRNPRNYSADKIIQLHAENPERYLRAQI